MQRSDNRLLLILSYTAVCIFWGSTYLAIRIGVRDYPPFLFAGVRHMLAGTILAAACLVARQPFPHGRRAWCGHGLVGLLMLAGANGLVVWSEQWVDSGVAALIVATVPLFAAGLGSLLIGGRIGGRGWLGLLAGLAGVAVLIGPAIFGGGWHASAAAPLLASFLWALGSVYSQRLPKEESFLPGVSLQMLAGGIVLCLSGLWTGEARRVHLTAGGSAALAYLVCCGSLLGYSAYLYLLRHLPAAKAATYAYVNPVIAVILGALVLGEQITARLLLAVPLILGGILLVQTAKTGKRDQQDSPATANKTPCST